MALSIRYNAPVILGFSLICTVVYLFNTSTNNAFLNLFTTMPNLNFSDPVRILTSVSHIFGHVGLDHLLGNLTFILLLGPIIEEKYGSQNLLIMILITAIFTSLLNGILFNTGLIGASGIVFMLIMVVSFTNVKSGEIPLTFILVAGLFVGKEIWNGLQNDGISQFAHIIGGFCGSLFGFMFVKNES